MVKHRKGKKLPPQGFRTPSDRREDLVVPESLLSSSNYGPYVPPEQGGVCWEEAPKEEGGKRKREGIEEELEVESVGEARGGDTVDRDLAAPAEQPPERRKYPRAIEEAKHQHKMVYDYMKTDASFKKLAHEMGDLELWMLKEEFVAFGEEDLRYQAKRWKAELGNGECYEDRLQETAENTGFFRKRSLWLLEEYDRRLTESDSTVRSLEGNVWGLEADCEALRTEKEAMAKELEELRSKVSAQHKEIADKEIQASAVCTPESIEVGEASLPAAEGLGGLLESIEALIDRKVENMVVSLGLLRAGTARDDSSRGARSSEKGGGNFAVSRRKRLETAQEQGTGSQPSVDLGPKKQLATHSTTGRVSQGGMARLRKRGLPPPEVPAQEEEEVRRKKKRRRKRWPTPPNTAAVMIAVPPGGGSSCADVLRTARERVSLEDIGIPSLQVKKARTGAYVFQISGKDAEDKADRLARDIGCAVEEKGATVTRPIKRMDIRVSGLQETATEEEIVSALVDQTGCRKADVRCGRIRSSPTGVGTLWIQCPMEAAIKVAKRGDLKVGWAKAAVETLRPRTQRCYRCLEVGHFRARCTSEVDRSTRCYRCGESGHGTASCREGVPRCPLCRDKGRETRHTLGGLGCLGSPPPP